MRTRSRRAVGAARALLTALGVQAPRDLDVELIAAYYDLYVSYRVLANEEGHLMRAGERGLIVVDEGARASHKWRFVIAHELGHFFLHPEDDHFHVCTARALRGVSPRNTQEAEANDFAAELLMPEALFAPRARVLDPSTPTSWDDVGALARAFRTSLTATALRWLYFTRARCAIVSSHGGRVEWWARTAAFIPHVRPRSTLHHATHAFALAHGQEMPRGPLPVESTAWTRTMRARRLELYEHSIRLRAYDDVLTLLWHR